MKKTIFKKKIAIRLSILIQDEITYVFFSLVKFLAGYAEERERLTWIATNDD